MPTAKLNTITQIPLFAGLTDVHYKQLENIAIEKKFAKGQTIFSQGEMGTGLYVLIEGLVRVYRISSDGREQIIHIVSEYGSFGDVPALTGGRYPAHADALKDSIVYLFSRDRFMELVRDDPDLSLRIIASMSNRLRELVGKVDELSLKDVPGRLASYLILESKRNNNSEIVNLEINKTLLASLLGTIPETLSRILTKMVQNDLIAFTQPRSIKILDREKLEDLALGETKLT